MSIIKSELEIKNQTGFIALMSAIIIAVILVGLTFAVSTSGYFSRFNVLDGEFKRISKGLAESCQNVALLKIAQNSNYAGNEINPNGVNCTILPISFNPPSGYNVNHQKVATIATQASYEGAFSNMQLAATVQDPNQAVVVPTTLTLTVTVPNGGPNTNQFVLYLDGSATAPDGSAVTSGKTYQVSAGAHTVSVNSSPSGYSSFGWAGACSGSAGSGSTGTLVTGSSNSCYINYTIVPTTAQLTVFANIIPTGGSTTLTIKDTTTNTTQTVTSGQAVSVNYSHAFTVAATTPSGYTASAWSGVCNANTGNILSSAMSAGNYYDCVINFTKPSTSCADTVMIFDRSGSMNSTDLDNENQAANTLISLYSQVVPPSKVGIGSFGGLDGSAASVPTQGQLTTNFGTDSGTANSSATAPSAVSTPNQWTNTSNAFANDASFTTDATSGHQQAYKNFNISSLPNGASVVGIAVVVDGKVSASTQNTGSLVPSSEGNYKSWNPSSGNNNSNNRVNSVSNSGGTYLRMPSYSANANANTFSVANAGVPANATINSVTFYALADTNGGNSNIQLRVENGTGSTNHKEDAGHAVSNAAFTSPALSWQMTTNPLTGAAWTAGEVNNWTTNFGVVRTNTTGGTPQVDQIYVVVNYTFAPAGSLGVSLSYNNGSSWIGTKTQSFSANESAYTLGSNSDAWGRTWATGDLTNTNFALRLTNNYTTGATVSVNYITVQIFYSSPASGLYAAADSITGSNSSVGTNLSAAITAGYNELISSRHISTNKQVLILVSDGEPNKPSGNLTNDTNSALAAATTAKNNNVTIFTVRYSTDTNAAGIQLLKNIATDPSDALNPGANPTAGQMQNFFSQIGSTVCPAAAASTQANLTVTVSVSNNFGGTSGAGDFAVNVTNASIPVAPLSSSVSGGSITYLYPSFGAGNSISATQATLSGYYAPQVVNCPNTTNIPLGQTQSCTFINYDTPPPPAAVSPPPPSSIGIGGWQETQ